MLKKIGIVVLMVSLFGCASQYEKNSDDYKASFEQAKKILKSDKAIERYHKYYYAQNNKALAQSKVNGAGAYAANKASKEFAIESALSMCHRQLLKKYEKISESISCEIVNINNDWIK